MGGPEDVSATMAMKAEASPPHQPHVVVLAFAQQGHINPLMQLSRKLASHGCFVTFVLSHNTVPSHSSHPNLHFAGVSDLLPPHRSRGSDIRDSVDSMANMQPGVRDLLHRLHVLKFHPVSLIIADVFMLWCLSLASEFSIPCAAFFTSNAASYSVFSHANSLLSQGVLPFPRDEMGNITAAEPVRSIPGVPPVLPEDFPQCLTLDSSHFRFQFILGVCKNCKDATAIILNTFDELEETVIEELRKVKPVYAVGPLLLLSGSPKRLDVNYWHEQDDCLQWLDTRERSSVLYISFGSVASLPSPHLKELALGIEASQQPFLWVIRPDSVDKSLADSLPDGFLSRTKDQGLIISWAPQLLVLSHPSVGGFLTHGGWNSIIENLSTGGVPMICWPHIAEQRLNRRLMAGLWKIGTEFSHTMDGMVKKEEVEKVVRCLMQGQEGKDMRETAHRVREKAKKATERGGLSDRSLEELIESLGIFKRECMPGTSL